MVNQRDDTQEGSQRRQYNGTAQSSQKASVSTVRESTASDTERENEAKSKNAMKQARLIKVDQKF